MNTIVQIAPQLPPALDGVGDYCWFLARHWPDAESRFRFLVLHGAEATLTKDASASVVTFSPNAQSLHQALEESGARVVVLHYVGYAYQPKGIPVWLPAALERWRNEGNDRRLITMFHEMYATSSPLRSAYWVKPWARQIMQRLVNASDAWVTSCSRYFDWLASEFHAEPKRGTLLPIAPNIPAAPEAEEERLWPLEFGRKLRVAVFGLPNTRLTALEGHQNLLSALLRTGVVDSVSLIGKSDFSSGYVRRVREFEERMGGEWHSQFDLPPAQAAEALAACDIGFVANDAGTLTKSGVFAALANNAVVCIASTRNGLRLGPPFNECVLLNNDRAPGIDALLAELTDSARMVARRRLTRAMAQNELSWTRIAAGWKDVLYRAIPAPERSAVSLTQNMNRPAPLAEVRA